MSKARELIGLLEGGKEHKDPWQFLKDRKFPVYLIMNRTTGTWHFQIDTGPIFSTGKKDKDAAIEHIKKSPIFNPDYNEIQDYDHSWIEDEKDRGVN